MGDWHLYNALYTTATKLSSILAKLIELILLQSLRTFFLIAKEATPISPRQNHKIFL